MTQDAPDVFGLVLAGGKSTRMGQDKAAMEWQGQRWLDRAVAAIAGAVPEVFVSLRDHSPVEAGDNLVIRDQFSNLGPAAGILSAHVQFPDNAWLVVACDMPLLSALIIRQLVAARNPLADATAMAAGPAEPAEPLCTIYEPATLAAFLAQVRAGGDSSPRNWLATVRTTKVIAAGAAALTNINTPDEWARLSNRTDGS